MTSWRNAPELKGRLHPDYPDDLQVVVHDGGPRTTDRSPELIWVRITGTRDGAFVGRVLNKPHQLESVRAADEILFVVPEGWEHPLRVTEQYLAERPAWDITPCGKCGLSELFDPPSVLMRVVFPNTPAGHVMQMFTVRCGSCGSAQVVQARGPEA
jgi:hypothetical protein